MAGSRNNLSQSYGLWLNKRLLADCLATVVNHLINQTLHRCLRLKHFSHRIDATMTIRAPGLAQLMYVSAKSLDLLT